MPKKLRPAVDLMAFKCRTLKVNARHPDVLLKTIKKYKYRQNITKFILLYHFWTTCFDSLVIIRPSNEPIQDYLILSALWDPVALTIGVVIVQWELVLDRFVSGPDDDSKESKHVALK
jgi:hypothetical protein